MGGYSKILVAFDGSESSRNALRQAVEQFHRSWIKVLAVVPAYEGDLELVGVRDLKGVLSVPTDGLLEVARELAGADADRIITNVEQGEVYEKIVDVARDEDCHLIVMGRRGLHRLENMLLGSVTARVITHWDGDVLVVPRDSKVQWSNIVVAVDGSSHSDAALDKAIELSRGRDDPVYLTIVSVTDLYPEFYADSAIVGSLFGSKKEAVVDTMEKKTAIVLERARSRAAAAGVEAGIELLRGDPAEEVAAYADQVRAGIIFAGSRGRSGLKKMLMGSVTEKIIGLSRCPVFITRAV
ncbi:MAG: universal stress protein [Gaiellales bacterium]|nr:MAG: universal stress protein [Gaiellales bacterium]